MKWSILGWLIVFFCGQSFSQICDEYYVWVGNYDVFKNESQKLKKLIEKFKDTIGVENYVCGKRDNIFFLMFFGRDERFYLEYLNSPRVLYSYQNFLRKDSIKRRIVVKLDSAYMFVVGSKEGWECVLDSMKYEGYQSIYMRWSICSIEKWREKGIVNFSLRGNIEGNTWIIEKFSYLEDVYIYDPPQKCPFWILCNIAYKLIDTYYKTTTKIYDKIRDNRKKKNNYKINKT